jgi:hypothetical protein
VTSFAFSDESERLRINGRLIIPADRNRAPWAESRSVEAVEDEWKEIVLHSDDGEMKHAPYQKLTYVIGALPSRGTLSRIEGGPPLERGYREEVSSQREPLKVYFKSAANLTDGQEFTFFVEDGDPQSIFGRVRSKPAVVRITVKPINDPPTIDPIKNPKPQPTRDGYQSLLLTGSTGGGGEIQELSVVGLSDDQRRIADESISIVPYKSRSDRWLLSFKPRLGASGFVNVRVTVTDDGTGGSGGVKSTTENFRIPVGAPKS